MAHSSWLAHGTNGTVYVMPSRWIPCLYDHKVMLWVGLKELWTHLDACFCRPEGAGLAVYPAAFTQSLLSSEYLLLVLQGARGFPGTPGLPGVKGHRVSIMG
jgi:hypothetical protein